jgi:phosphoribosylformylglycinamidine synthase
MKRLLAAIGIALGVGLVLFALFAAKSDEERIRERLAQLARAVSVDEDENILFRKSRLDRELEQVFTPDVHVDLPELGARPRSRSELVRLATAATRHYRSLDVQLDAERIDVAGDHAEVQAQAELVSAGDDPGRQRRRVTFRLVKDPSLDWQITAARVE